MKVYEGLKHNSYLSFDNIAYDLEFSSKKGFDLNDKSKENVVLDDDFIKAANAILDQNTQIEEAFVEKLKDSQLDYILKFNKKVTSINIRFNIKRRKLTLSLKRLNYSLDV